VDLKQPYKPGGMNTEKNWLLGCVTEKKQAGSIAWKFKISPAAAKNKINNIYKT